MIKDKLIVFQKNPVISKVKTRLASDIGNDNALQVYFLLLDKTKEAVEKLDQNIHVFYSDFVDENDLWSGLAKEKEVQSGLNLGERLKDAFERSYNSGAEKVVVIGCDCPDISENDIQTAFNHLDDSDFVIGPSRDGGYYLLGMKKYCPQVFEGITWSTEDVFSETLERINQLDMEAKLLRPLMDIDTFQDLKSNASFYKDAKDLIGLSHDV